MVTDIPRSVLMKTKNCQFHYMVLGLRECSNTRQAIGWFSEGEQRRANIVERKQMLVCGNDHRTPEHIPEIEIIST